MFVHPLDLIFTPVAVFQDFRSDFDEHNVILPNRTNDQSCEYNTEVVIHFSLPVILKLILQFILQYHHYFSFLFVSKSTRVKGTLESFYLLNTQDVFV